MKRGAGFARNPKEKRQSTTDFTDDTDNFLSSVPSVISVVKKIVAHRTNSDC
jgi:hypothetical protein